MRSSSVFEMKNPRPKPAGDAFAVALRQIRFTEPAKDGGGENPGHRPGR